MALCTAVAFMLCVRATLAQGVEQRPNVLLIYVDDMGYNDLACYGARDPGESPHLSASSIMQRRFVLLTAVFLATTALHAKTPPRQEDSNPLKLRYGAEIREETLAQGASWNWNPEDTQ
jgi:hypothetical protein